MTADRPMKPGADPEVGGVEKGLAQLNAGLSVPLEAVEAWIDSWDTPNELPMPLAEDAPDPAYSERVLRELAGAEEEARRGEGISLEEFEREAEALRDEIRADVKAGRIKP